eukprot:TRINITY_DN11491_c0_g1_i1.p1 TRINITY_DN11491_c0_g1~~TRINITY_DN11491_c0_g1_i1.p1  ORF type:complete len:359 (-),score=40.58 TRINITY_DN11491_c0_g1_i1:85-1161(-)
MTTPALKSSLVSPRGINKDKEKKRVTFFDNPENLTAKETNAPAQQQKTTTTAKPASSRPSHRFRQTPEATGHHYLQKSFSSSSSGPPRTSSKHSNGDYHRPSSRKTFSASESTRRPRHSDRADFEFSPPRRRPSAASQFDSPTSRRRKKSSTNQHDNSSNNVFPYPVYPSYVSPVYYQAYDYDYNTHYIVPQYVVMPSVTHKTSDASSFRPKQQRSQKLSRKRSKPTRSVESSKKRHVSLEKKGGLPHGELKELQKLFMKLDREQIGTLPKRSAFRMLKVIGFHKDNMGVAEQFWENRDKISFRKFVSFYIRFFVTKKCALPGGRQISQDQYARVASYKLDKSGYKHISKRVRNILLE